MITLAILAVSAGMLLIMLNASREMGHGLSDVDQAYPLCEYEKRFAEGFGQLSNPASRTIASPSSEPTSAVS